jgi:hypothetical protein
MGVVAVIIGMGYRKCFIAAVTLVCLAGLAGCSTGTPSSTSSLIVSPNPAASPATNLPATKTQSLSPSIQIVSPSPAASTGIGFVTIIVNVSNFSLVNKSGQINAANQGHIIYYLGVDPPTAPGLSALTAPGSYAETADTSYVWSNLGSGQYKFSVELVNNDGTPLSPAATASTSVLVQPESGFPVAVIVSPREGSIVTGKSVTVTAEVNNFNLVDKIGQPNVPSEGHLNYYMDVDAPTLNGPPATTAPGSYISSANTSYTWQNVTPGTHSFSVELVNNDNTPLNPPFSTKVTVTVSSPDVTPTVVPSP